MYLYIYAICKDPLPIIILIILNCCWKQTIWAVYVVKKKKEKAGFKSCLFEYMGIRRDLVLGLSPFCHGIYKFNVHNANKNQDGTGKNWKKMEQRTF